MTVGNARDRANAFLPYPGVPVAHAGSGGLGGCRLAVKDLFDVAGYPTGAGNAIVLAASGIKQVTAPIVQALLDDGAEFAGKTYTDELAYSLIGKNDHFGAPINPRWPELIPGGSSSGSAVAVAAGLADIGLGTDTSGSIRLPAAANGVYGWRATHGMLPLAGCRALAPSFDTVGFLANSLSKIAGIMDALRVPAVASRDIGLVAAQDLLDICDARTVEQFERALAAAKQEYRVIKTAIQLDLDEARGAFNTMLWREAYLANETLVSAAPESIAPAIRFRLERGRRIGAHELAEARAIRDKVRSNLHATLGEATVLLMPTLPTPPPSHRRNGRRARSLSHPFHLDALHRRLGRMSANCGAVRCSARRRRLNLLRRIAGFGSPGSARGNAIRGYHITNVLRSAPHFPGVAPPKWLVRFRLSLVAKNSNTEGLRISPLLAGSAYRARQWDCLTEISVSIYWFAKS